VTLSAEVIDLVWLQFVDDLDQASRLGDVGVMQQQAHVRLMRVSVEMLDAIGVEARRAPYQAMHLVATVE
jgi:hypothetical protein